MSRSERDATRIVRLWLEEGVTALPDRVLDAVIDQLPATSQRRPSWLARRTPNMNNTVRLVLAAAAVVVVALVGYQLLVAPNISGPPPALSPSPPAEPSTSSRTPTPAVIGEVPTGALDPGIYLMPREYGGVAFTFTVPAGWEVDGDAFVQKNTDSDSVGENTMGVMFSAWMVDHVFADSCVGEGTEQPVEDTVDALATALASQVRPGFESRGPAPGLTFDGYPVLHVRLYTPGDLGDCGGRLRTWPGLNGDLNSGWPASPGQTDDVYIVDVDGGRLVLVGTYWAGTTTDDRRELDRLILFIDIVPR